MKKVIPTTDDRLCPLFLPIIILKRLILGTLELSAAVTDSVCQSEHQLPRHHGLTKSSLSCHRVEDVDRRQGMQPTFLFLL